MLPNLLEFPAYVSICVSQETGASLRRKLGE